MIFVKEHILDSTYLRGDQVAAELGVPCLTNSIGDAASGDVVVFVKTARDEVVDDARRRGCRIAYDPIDYLCYDEDGRPMPQWYSDVDVVIVPNGKAEAILRPQFQKAQFVVIPHQWDARIKTRVEHDEFRVGYVGRRFNLPVSASIPQVTEPDQMLRCLDWFNCHVDIKERDSLAWNLKPATKVASAAAVGACIITTGDPSAFHLLGPDYPFYLPGAEHLDAAISYCRDRFNGPKWHAAGVIMDEVRRKTSVHAIADLYREIE